MCDERACPTPDETASSLILQHPLIQTIVPPPILPVHHRNSPAHTNDIYAPKTECIEHNRTEYAHNALL